MKKDSNCNCIKMGLVQSENCLIRCGVQLDLFTSESELYLKLNLADAVEQHLEQNKKKKK